MQIDWATRLASYSAWPFFCSNFVYRSGFIRFSRRTLFNSFETSASVHALPQFECLNGSGKYSVLSILHTDLVTACNKQSVNKIQLYHPWHEKKLFIEKQCFARNFVRSTHIGHSTHHV